MRNDLIVRILRVTREKCRFGRGGGRKKGEGLGRVSALPFFLSRSPPWIITKVPETNKIEPKSYSIIPCLCIQALACFEHSNFFKVNVTDPEKKIVLYNT